jgi:hypothetical protein
VKLWQHVVVRFHEPPKHSFLKDGLGALDAFPQFSFPSIRIKSVFDEAAAIISGLQIGFVI